MLSATGAGKKGTAPEWITMSFPKEPVAFQKVRLFGMEIKDVKISYLKRGEWVETEAVVWPEGAPSVEISFPEKVSTVKVRLDFTPRSGLFEAELYEIELF